MKELHHIVCIMYICSAITCCQDKDAIYDLIDHGAIVNLLPDSSIVAVNSKGKKIKIDSIPFDYTTCVPVNQEAFNTLESFLLEDPGNPSLHVIVSEEFKLYDFLYLSIIGEALFTHRVYYLNENNETELLFNGFLPRAGDLVYSSVQRALKLYVNRNEIKGFVRCYQMPITNRYSAVREYSDCEKGLINFCEKQTIKSTKQLCDFAGKVPSQRLSLSGDYACRTHLKVKDVKEQLLKIRDTKCRISTDYEGDISVLESVIRSYKLDFDKPVKFKYWNVSLSPI